MPARSHMRIKESREQPEAMLAGVSPIFAARYCGTRDRALAALHETSIRQQWSPADLIWQVDTPFGSPLPRDSELALTVFRDSPLARYGPATWDAFRWQFQGWMVSQ